MRAVSPEERRSPRKAPSSVAQAVESGTRRDELVAMRTRIAKAIDDPNIRGADLAALSRRLLEIGKEIEAIDSAAEQEDRDANPSPDEAFDSSAI
ncbi:MAG: hypothetical protein HOV76_32335 [Hamadaea sp.]|nr:hypothetical protein [Catenulispora sp.]NUT08166.1 hypothetical protein [Hamadaea sp.]